MRTTKETKRNERDGSLALARLHSLTWGSHVGTEGFSCVEDAKHAMREEEHNIIMHLGPTTCTIQVVV